jgi:hypothetical protein
MEIWIGFLTNLLGVIHGIILTFGVTALWQRRREKQTTKEMLILVRNELAFNKIILQHLEQMMKNQGYVYRKILENKNDLTAIPTDTLKEYHTQISGISIVNMTTTAWKIFQNSDMIQKMTNRELIIRLAGCYNAMTTWMDSLNKDYWTVLRRILTLELDDSYRFFETAVKNNEYLTFFDSYSDKSEGMWAAFSQINAFIDYTMQLLDKHGDYRYDMEEKDSEFEAFINERAPGVFTQNDFFPENSENE